MSWSTKAGEDQNQDLQHYMDSYLAQQTPQAKIMKNYRKTVINGIISQTSQSMHNMNQKNDSSTTSKKFFTEAKKKTGLNQLKHILKMNASTQASTVPKASVLQGIKEKEIKVNDEKGEFIPT